MHFGSQPLAVSDFGVCVRIATIFFSRDQTGSTISDLCLFLGKIGSAKESIICKKLLMLYRWAIDPLFLLDFLVLDAENLGFGPGERFWAVKFREISFGLPLA